MEFFETLIGCALRFHKNQRSDKKKKPSAKKASESIAQQASTSVEKSQESIKNECKGISTRYDEHMLNFKLKIKF